MFNPRFFVEILKPSPPPVCFLPALQTQKNPHVFPWVSWVFERGSYMPNRFKASTSLGPEQRDAWEKWMKIQTKVWMKMLSDGQ